MKPRLFLVFMMALVLGSGAWGQDTPASDDPEAEMKKVQSRVKVQGKVCPDPDRPCQFPGDPFKPNELSFEAAEKFNFDRGQDRSAPFYAVILKSAPLCGATEEERLRVQALFPRYKVFAHRYFCEDFSDNVTYTNVNAKLGFIAVYAGETEQAAQAFLARLRVGGQFPGANLRKMQVVIIWQLE